MASAFASLWMTSVQVTRRLVICGHFHLTKSKLIAWFVREVTASSNGAAIVRAIAGFLGRGYKLGMETTAEGVETENNLISFAPKVVRKCKGSTSVRHGPLMNWREC